MIWQNVWQIIVLHTPYKIIIYGYLLKIIKEMIIVNYYYHPCVSIVRLFEWRRNLHLECLILLFHNCFSFFSSFIPSLCCLIIMANISQVSNAKRIHVQYMIGHGALVGSSNFRHWISPKGISQMKCVHLILLSLLTLFNIGVYL